MQRKSVKIKFFQSFYEMIEGDIIKFKFKENGEIEISIRRGQQKKSFKQTKNRKHKIPKRKYRRNKQ